MQHYGWGVAFRSALRTEAERKHLGVAGGVTVDQGAKLFAVGLLGGAVLKPPVGGGVGDQDLGARSLGRLRTKATIPVRTTIRATMPAMAAV